VAVALYRRAAVRHAAVDRYLLPTAMFAAVTHAGTDRQTDILPFHRPCSVIATNWRPDSRKKVNRLINFTTEYQYKDARTAHNMRQLHSLCYFHKKNIWAHFPAKLLKNRPVKKFRKSVKI